MDEQLEKLEQLLTEAMTRRDQLPFRSSQYYGLHGKVEGFEFVWDHWDEPAVLIREIGEERWLARSQATYELPKDSSRNYTAGFLEALIEGASLKGLDVPEEET